MPNKTNRQTKKVILTHWGGVTHICVSKLTIIVSDNGLSPGRCQTIIWTNDGILLIRALGTNFSEILGKIHLFSFKKMRLKMSSAKGRLFSLDLNELTFPCAATASHQGKQSLTCFFPHNSAPWPTNSPSTERSLCGDRFAILTWRINQTTETWRLYQLIEADWRICATFNTASVNVSPLTKCSVTLVSILWTLNLNPTIDEN